MTRGETPAPAPPDAAVPVEVNQAPSFGFGVTRLSGNRCRLEGHYTLPTTKPFLYRARLTVQWRNPPSHKWHMLARRRVTRRVIIPQGQPPTGTGRAAVTIELDSAGVSELTARGARFRAVTAQRVAVPDEPLRRERMRNPLRLAQCELGGPGRHG